MPSKISAASDHMFTTKSQKACNKRNSGDGEICHCNESQTACNIYSSNKLTKWLSEAINQNNVVY